MLKWIRAWLWRKLTPEHLRFQDAFGAPLKITDMKQVDGLLIVYLDVIDLDYYKNLGLKHDRQD